MIRFQFKKKSYNLTDVITITCLSCSELGREFSNIIVQARVQHGRNDFVKLCRKVIFGIFDQITQITKSQDVPGSCSN